jgi:hypothetical protein
MNDIFPNGIADHGLLALGLVVLLGAVGLPMPAGMPMLRAGIFAR